jgi:hypothetical protein
MLERAVPGAPRQEAGSMVVSGNAKIIKPDRKNLPAHPESRAG